MNQYQLRKNGYADDEDYIRQELRRKDIPFNTTYFSDCVIIEVKINTTVIIRYKFQKGEIIEQTEYTPRIQFLR